MLQHAKKANISYGSIKQILGGSGYCGVNKTERIANAKGIWATNMHKCIWGFKIHVIGGMQPFIIMP